MKKLVLLLVVLLAGMFCLTSCSEIEPSDSQTKENTLQLNCVRYYNGHRYLQFRNFYGLYHDPDCPLCKENE